VSARVRALGVTVALLASPACRADRPARADSGASLAAPGTSLRVTILGDPRDPRVGPAREALGHWNGELARLQLGVRLDSGTVASGPLPEDALRAASGAKRTPWGWWADARLRATLDPVPGDIVVALSRTDLISFSVPWSTGHKGVVGLRRSDIRPLSLPNTVRNVVAHELGHVLGLSHNADSTTLMCGRPAPCRPAAFASDSAHVFPLTADDERSLRRRWP
jgi:hypothetical protein